MWLYNGYVWAGAEITPCSVHTVHLFSQRLPFFYMKTYGEKRAALKKVVQHPSILKNKNKKTQQNSVYVHTNIGASSVTCYIRVLVFFVLFVCFALIVGLIYYSW